MNKKIFVLIPQLILCCLMVSVSFADTLDVGDGIGRPGVHDKTVGVSLDNSVTVKSVDMYVCDVDDFLHCSGCEGVGRASGMDCFKSEQSGGAYDGCVWVNLTGGSITSGSGDIITLTYNVDIDAPEGECRNLNPVDVEVLDLSDNPISVTPVSGEFCYKCVSSAECMDSLYCNGEEFCDDNGVCQLGHCSVTGTILCSDDSDCPGGEVCVDDVACPDDGEFCNGAEYCIEIIDQCGHTGDPCSPQLCEEGDDSCYCTGPQHCDDGLYCTGVETCVGQVCQPADNPCEEPEPVCDEDTQQCYVDDVTLTVEDGSGFPGSGGNPVDVRLYNPNNRVLGVELEICDEGPYHLACTGCDTTGLVTDGFDCGTNDDGGCCNVALFHRFGYSIPEGNRIIFTIYYDVSEDIPPGCLDLDLENIVVSNEDPPPLKLWALPVPGEFCDQCVADFMGDGDVDGTDALVFKADFFRKDCSNPDPCNGDFGCDGDVDGSDAVVFKDEFFRKDCALFDPGEPFCIYE